MIFLLKKILISRRNKNLFGKFEYMWFQYFILKISKIVTLISLIIQVFQNQNLNYITHFSKKNINILAIRENTFQKIKIYMNPKLQASNIKNNKKESRWFWKLMKNFERQNLRKRNRINDISYNTWWDSGNHYCKDVFPKTQMCNCLRSWLQEINIIQRTA